MSASECDSMESLKLADSSTDSKSTTPSVTETRITVPSIFADFPLGFALDAGGSVTKVVYRSKLDYTNGHPNNGEHALRLRFFPNHQGDALVEFLKENCDVRIPPQNGGADERPLYYQTGVGVQHYVKKLEEAFQCRIKLVPETNAAFDGILRVCNLIPYLSKTVPYSVAATTQGLVRIRDVIMMLGKAMATIGENAYGDVPPPKEGFDVQAYMMSLMTKDPAELAAELNTLPITYPCVMTQCGSATTSVILQENGRHAMGDFKPTAGKTLLALGRLLTGAQTFEELMELALKGDRSKVNVSCGETKSDNRDADWYNLMPDSFICFVLGKAAEQSYDGSYSKADIAAALIQMHCQELVQFSYTLARLHNTPSILLCGSFMEWPLTQQLAQEAFLYLTLISPCAGEPQRTLSIIPKCGFLPALGVWYKNNKEFVDAKASATEAN